MSCIASSASRGVVSGGRGWRKAKDIRAVVGASNSRDTPASAARARLAALYEELLPVVYGYARSRLTEPDAEDVTADVFRAAAELVHADPDAQLAKSWFVTAARHRIIDRWRLRTRWEGRLELVRRDVEGPASTSGESDDAPRVLAALDSLAPDHRVVLVLRYVEGLSTREVADAIGRSAFAVDSLVARARRAFAVAYEEMPL
jgi:RNA polymerase sigma-70 factor (ECF subfamily)